MQLLEANKITAGSLELWLHALVSAWNTAVGRKRKEARQEFLWQRSRKQVGQVDKFCAHITSSERLPGTSEAAVVPSCARRNAFSRVICQQPGDVSVQVEEQGPGCTSDMPRCLVPFLVVLVGSQEQQIWELTWWDGVRGDLPVFAQACATVVIALRPLVPCPSCSCGGAKTGAEMCSVIFERRRRHCCSSDRKWPVTTHGLKLFSCPFQAGIFFPASRSSWRFRNSTSKQIGDASSQWQVKWSVFMWLWDFGESWTHLTINLCALRHANLCELLVSFKCDWCSFIFVQCLGMPSEKGS